MKATILTALAVLIWNSFALGEDHSGHPAPAAPPAETNAASAALPTKPSEDQIEILEASTRTNRISSLQKTADIAKYQTALESARKLHEDKELKRSESAFIQLLEGRAPEEIKRPALLDLAMVMQAQREYSKAQQLYSEYVRRFEKDPGVPEVLLRQAYLYREMGLPVMALSKYYAVISTCLNLKLDQMEYYQKLVLRAQAEIAETYFLQGKFEEAEDYYQRLLRLESTDLERAEVIYKLVRCYSSLGKMSEAIANARLFLEKFSDHFNAPETRFLLASALKKLGQNKEAIQEIGVLLQTQQAQSKGDPQQWLYWQQRAGNEIANQLYREGDFLNALQVYQSLAELNKSPEWQIPVWYQIGLVFENLKQGQKASDIYDKIVVREKETAQKAPNAALRQVAEMAAWRKQFLGWEENARVANQQWHENEPKRDSL